MNRINSAKNLNCEGFIGLLLLHVLLRTRIRLHQEWLRLTLATHR